MEFFPSSLNKNLFCDPIRLLGDTFHVPFFHPSLSLTFLSLSLISFSQFERREKKDEDWIQTERKTHFLDNLLDHPLNSVSKFFSLNFFSFSRFLFLSLDFFSFLSISFFSRCLPGSHPIHVSPVWLPSTVSSDWYFVFDQEMDQFIP